MHPTGGLPHQSAIYYGMIATGNHHYFNSLRGAPLVRNDNVSLRLFCTPTSPGSFDPGEAFSLLGGRGAVFLPGSNSWAQNLNIGKPKGNFRGIWKEAHRAGSSTAMVVPPSELSATQTRPPWRLAISHTRDSPSPAPPNSRLRDLSTRKNGWKMLR